MNWLQNMERMDIEIIPKIIWAYRSVVRHTPGRPKVCWKNQIHPGIGKSR
jgi:hypothetical protein